MIYLFLAFLLITYNHEFSFKSPIIQRNFSQIGSWFFRGSALNMKKFVRLTSFLTNDYGGICSIEPFPYEDFTLTLNFSLFYQHFSQKNLDSHSYLLLETNTNNLITISFTEELCPESSTLSWKGFKLQIHFTLTERDDNLYLGKFKVELLQNNGTLIGFSEKSEISDFLIDFDDYHRFLIFQISKEKESFNFFYTQASNLIDEAFTPFGSFQMHFDQVYFMIGCETNKTTEMLSKKLVTDLYSVSIEGKGKHNTTSLQTINKNRKYLSLHSSPKFSAKKAKMSQMKKSKLYKEEMDYNDGHLDNMLREDVTFNDSFIEINEMLQRARNDLTLYHLQYFIENVLDQRLETALSTIEKIIDDIGSLKLDLIETWNSVQNELKGMSASIYTNFTDIRSYSENIVALHLKQNSKKNNTISFKIPSGLTNHSIQKIIFIICAAEFVMFVIFFLIKRQTTHNWKKID